MTEKKSPYCGCLLYSANALGRVITRMAEEGFAHLGLGPSYAFLLMTVHNNPGVQPSDIAEKMMLSPSTVTRLVEKMEKQGFVLRASEGKFIRVQPTQKTLDLYPGILVAWRALYQRYADVLGVEFAKQLSSDCYVAALQLERR